uniref:Equilibrative nucleoside transporter n=1 Tax=Kalanchoe fedtschenkoi TaxID=63787 RepID=A0A7N0TJB4_KALFE
MSIYMSLKGRCVLMILCWLLGTGSLFPWNSMLNVIDFYTDLFPKYHPSRVLSVVYSPIAFATLAVMVCFESSINTRRRNLTGYTIYFVVSVFILVLETSMSRRGGLGNFIGVCFSSGAIGYADAHVAGGMIGELAFMQPEFTQSFLAGMAASGALTSGLRLVTKAAFKNAKTGMRTGALTFFALSAGFNLFCVLLYAFVFPKLPLVKHYRLKAASEGSKTVLADLAAAGIRAQTQNEDEARVTKDDRLSVIQLLVENLDYGFDTFLVSTVTLSIFPGFLFEDTGHHSLGSWYALILIAVYNLWDLIGRYVPLIKFMSIESRKVVLALVCSRLLFVPAFYFTAKYGAQGWMIFLTSFLGITNGYFSVCIFTAAPKGYIGPEQNALGNLLCLCLQGGIFIGIALDWLWLIGKGW